MAWAVPSAITAYTNSKSPSVAWGWGDNGESVTGRVSYTLDQVNAGALGDEIVFNSISDSVIGDEKNFVGVRWLSGSNDGPNNVWNGNWIDVEENSTYLVRLYVHNNNPKGEQAASEGTTVAFSIPKEPDKELTVWGCIESSNASPSRYWDSVVFRSDRSFRLEYVRGSALLENNGIGANGGVTLDDAIAEGEKVAIGYESLDGNVPGCYEYASYVTVVLRPVFID